jgi:hypothetical protein
VIKNYVIVNLFFCWMIRSYSNSDAEGGRSHRPDQVHKLESDRKTPFFQAIALPQYSKSHKRAKSSKILN